MRRLVKLTHPLAVKQGGARVHIEAEQHFRWRAVQTADHLFVKRATQIHDI
jgi:hypothetical protein